MKLLALISAYIGLLWTGCSVPPDWSVCECNWLDNTWFHHITILDSYSGENFAKSLVDLSHPLHAWILKQECPQQISTFLYNSEGKMYSFDPKGLIKLSHEAWRPENRQTITSTCAVGNMLLHFWCSHQFLYKAGSPSVVLDPTRRWDMLRGWYAHMKALQQFIELPELQSCLSRSSFPFSPETVTGLHDWAFASIGNATLGEEPKLLFNKATGLIDLPSFVFPLVLRHSRRRVNPKNRVCLPLSDRTCWPEKAHWQSESCTLCCDPSKGPFGDPSCFVGGRSFARCCQTDFAGVMCDEVRKSTPGCLDCPQHLSFFCAEENRFRVVKAWSLMNETFWNHKEELNTTIGLEKDVSFNEENLLFYEKKFNKSLFSFVQSQTDFFVRQNNIAEFAIDRQNETLRHYVSEIRAGIEKNFTLARRAKETVFNAFKSANDSYHKAVRDEQKEIKRKIELEEYLAKETFLDEFYLLGNLTIVCHEGYVSNITSLTSELAHVQREELRLAVLQNRLKVLDDEILKQAVILGKLKKPEKKKLLALELALLLANEEVDSSTSWLLLEGQVVLEQYKREVWLEALHKLENLEFTRERLKGKDDGKQFLHEKQRLQIEIVKAKKCKNYSKERHKVLSKLSHEMEVAKVEFSLKDSLIDSLRSKQKESLEKQEVTLPKMEPALVEFTMWNQSMNNISAVVEAERTKLALIATGDFLGPIRQQYHAETVIHTNNSDWLNKTFLNLTEYQNKLTESRAKTIALVNDFKNFELEYFKFDEIYRKKSENGEISITNFTFEY